MKKNGENERYFKKIARIYREENILMEPLSILLTARTNYYGLIENEVEYITWAELVKNVEQNRL